METKLSSPTNLIRQALLLFFKKENFIYFLKLMLIVLVLVFGVGFLTSLITGGAFFVNFHIPPLSYLFIAIIFLVLMTASILIGVWAQVALYESVYRVVKKEPLEVKETLKMP